MSNIINERLTEDEVMGLIYGFPEVEFDECIRPDTEEYEKFKPPYPRWKIGCSRPSFAPALVPYKESDLVDCRLNRVNVSGHAAKAQCLSGRTEDSLSPDRPWGGWGRHSGPISRPIKAEKNFKKSKPKRKRRKVTYKRNTRKVKTWAECEEEKFRESHVVREFTDLDGSKFAAWVPKDTSDKEALTAAFENSLAGHRDGKIKDKLIELMKERLETYEDKN